MDDHSATEASPRIPRAAAALTLPSRLWLLVALLAALWSAGAMCAAQPAAAATFPTTELLDSFVRPAESPLSDGGKWSKLAWTKTVGRVFSERYGWVPKEGRPGAPESEADGAYWNVQQFGGSSVAVSTHIYAEDLHDYVALWCDTTGTGSKNGYRVKAVGTATNYGFKLILEKWVGGARTVLGESPEVPFKGLSSENVVGIAAINGKVSAWYGTTEASLAVEVEATDSTFSRGYVGIEGTNNDAYGETQFRASSFPVTESVDTFERPAENPLSDGGKWSKLAWTKTIGRVYSEQFGWVPSEGGLEAPESEADGAYWNAGGSSSPAVSVHILPENRRDYVALWCDTTGAGSKNGYRLKVVGSGTNYGFKLILEKWVEGNGTLLGESPEIDFLGGSSENVAKNVVGLTAINGKVAAWYGTTEGGLAVKVEASDTTFSRGHVGIEGTDEAAFGETKYRASLNESAPSNTAVPSVHGPAIEYHWEESAVGSWSGTEPITYAYQWERCAPSGGCTSIQSANEAVYKAESADVGDTLRVKVTATNSVGSSSAYSNATATIASDPCRPEHCYAYADQEGVTTAGLNLSIETNYVSVPDWEEDFVTNEAWSGFSDGGWVEGGAVSGTSDSGSGSGYVYFTATKHEPSGEFDTHRFENGPEGNTFFQDDQHYVGNGDWYVTVGNDLMGWGEEPTTASRAKAGLEENDNNIANWGHLAGLSWWDPTTGVKHQGWSPEGSYDMSGLTCISLQGDEEAYFVANGNPCELGARAPDNAPVGGNAATEPATSSPLTTKAALDAGRRFALREGEDATPQSIEVYSTTEATAMAVAEPRASLPSSDATSSSVLAEPVYVDVMSGDFTLNNVPVPPGATAPTGKSLVVVSNARTGHVLDVALKPSPPSLSALGPAVASSE